MASRLWLLIQPPRLSLLLRPYIRQSLCHTQPPPLALRSQIKAMSGLDHDWCLLKLSPRVPFGGAKRLWPPNALHLSLIPSTINLDKQRYLRVLVRLGMSSMRPERALTASACRFQGDSWR